MPFIRIMKPARISVHEHPQFLKRLSALLKEGYLFQTALFLLLPLHVKRFEEASEEIDAIFRSGGTAAELLEFLGFTNSVLVTVEIAEHHGRLAESIEAAAYSTERAEKIKHKLKTILLYPVSLLLFTALLFLVFRTVYVPDITELASSLHKSESSVSAAVHLLKLPDLFIGVFFTGVVSAALFSLFLNSKSVERRIFTLLKIPWLNRLLKMYWTQQFSRELGTLLHSGISLQHSLALLQGQNRHDVFQLISYMVRNEVTAGISLSEAVSRQPMFTADLSSFTLQGETTGHLGKELILYSEMLTDRLETNVQQVIRLVQPLFFILIATCIVGAYLAILLPMYQLIHTI